MQERKQLLDLVAERRKGGRIYIGTCFSSSQCQWADFVLYLCVCKWGDLSASYLRTDELNSLVSCREEKIVARWWLLFLYVILSSKLSLRTCSAQVLRLGLQYKGQNCCVLFSYLRYICSVRYCSRIMCIVLHNLHYIHIVCMYL